MSHTDRTLAAFTDGLAGPTTPAGGSAAAVAGAMGAALCEMVAAQAPPGGSEGAANDELARAGEDLRERRAALLELADEDTAAVEAAFLDADPDEAARERALEVPVAIAEACLAVLEAGAVVADHAEGTVAVDAATGAILARSGLRAAALTVRTNHDLVADEATAERAASRADEAETAGEEALQAVLAAVDAPD